MDDKAGCCGGALEVAANCSDMRFTTKDDEVGSRGDMSFRAPPAQTDEEPRQAGDLGGRRGTAKDPAFGLFARRDESKKTTFDERII